MISLPPTISKLSSPRICTTRAFTVRMHESIITPSLIRSGTSKPADDSSPESPAYMHISRETFHSNVQQGKFIAWGEHNGHYYGQVNPEARLRRAEDAQNDGDDKVAAPAHKDDDDDDEEESTSDPNITLDDSGRRISRKTLRLSRKGVKPEELHVVEAEIKRIARERRILEDLNFQARQKELGPLPPNWEMMFTDDGEEYFVKYVTSSLLYYLFLFFSPLALIRR